MSAKTTETLDNVIDTLEAAKLLNIGTSAGVIYLIRTGQLAGKKLASGWVVDRQDCERLAKIPRVSGPKQAQVDTLQRDKKSGKFREKTPDNRLREPK